MKFWRPGITGKLFLAIFATCIVLLITMHWAVRVSFERGFIDYIKHGNEQRLQGLSDALAEQYALHGNWRFLRNNDRFIFQILRSLEHDTDDDRPGPGMPPHGWRTQFWVIDQDTGWVRGGAACPGAAGRHEAGHYRQRCCRRLGDRLPGRAADA